MTTRTTRFWLTMAVFQIGFGVGVFVITRHYYIAAAVDTPAPAAKAALSLRWPDVAPMAPRAPTAAESAASADPLTISTQADAAFADKQYDRAAELYEQLLQLDASNVDIYNNLGITLHYLGRSEEALRRLGEGVALNPQHQRIWLTTGFVNLQLGNTERARTALTNAASLGTDASIRDSAQKMLASLP